MKFFSTECRYCDFHSCAFDFKKFFFWWIFLNSLMEMMRICYEKWFCVIDSCFVLTHLILMVSFILKFTKKNICLENNLPILTYFEFTFRSIETLKGPIFRIWIRLKIVFFSLTNWEIDICFVIDCNHWLYWYCNWRETSIIDINFSTFGFGNIFLMGKKNWKILPTKPQPQSNVHQSLPDEN